MTENPTAQENQESKTIYHNFPFLKPHREYLGELQDSDILGEGAHGIVIRSRRNNSVVKIAKTEHALAEFDEEFELHNRFLSALIDGWSEGKIPRNLKIPAIEYDANEMGSKLVFELVKGQTIFTHHLRQKYSQTIEESDDQLDRMTDYQVEQLLQRKYRIHVDADRIYDGDKKGVFYVEQYFPEIAEELKGALQYLEDKGCKHGDLHSRNLMLCKNGDYYIIDMGPNVPNTDRNPGISSDISPGIPAVFKPLDDDES
jgi:serine/threonine protein kinase